MLSSLFNPNSRELNKLKKIVKTINSYHKNLTSLSDEEIKTYFLELKEPSLEEVFAYVKEATKRTLGFDTYDVQMLGSIVLSQGNIAEMKTGEGKTLVAVATAIYKSFYGKVHIVTVNDYLAKRDAELMNPLYSFLGKEVGVVISTTLNNRKEEYSKDIVYVTNNEIAFDYLRDNLAADVNFQVLSNKFDFAIVDEVDSVLIDEARSPLVISDVIANQDIDIYHKANEVITILKEGKEVKNAQGKIEEVTGDFIVDSKHKIANLTEKGIAKVEKHFEIENLYDSDKNVILSHAIKQALIANFCFDKDFDYIISNEKVLIIDENTGRVAEGKRFSDGLHQAIEVKENIKPKPENQTIASVSYQNFFKKYKELSGMTGTAITEASEFKEIYNLDVIQIPTNKDLIRKDLKDIIYFSEKEKIEAIISDVKKINKTGQPILIGTASVDKSELLDKALTKAGLNHIVLNAKNHEKEADIIASAGEKGNITVATHMAGRGVDIKISEEVVSLGGLYIIGTERHLSRRVDNQLRGRSGRQGDPGTSQFYLSLEDELIQKFAGEKVQSIIKTLNLSKGETINSKIVTRAIEKAQEQIENLHFEYRKNIVNFDDVNNEQRNVIYDIRQNILNKTYNIGEKTKEYFILFASELIDDLESESDFNVKKEKELLVKYFADNYSVGIENIIESISDDDYSENKIDKISELMILTLNQKAVSVGMSLEDLNQMQRIILLQILDKEWRDHLHQLDVLSTGIGLRSYNQKDPVIEYKKDAYHMFESLIHSIKKDYIEYLNKVRFNIRKP